MPSEKGGYWATTGSMKTGVSNGKDKYEASFSLDSDYEKSQMLDFVIKHVEREIALTQNVSTSAFNANTSQQPIQHQLQQSQAYQAHTNQSQNINGNPYQGNVSMGQQRPPIQQQQSIFNDDNVPF